MLDITVTVPDERVPEFYEFFGRWLGGKLTAVGEGVTTPSDLPPEPWRIGDEELAQEVWIRLSERAQGLVSLLADNADERFSGEELAERLNIPHGRFGVAGTLAWPGRHSYAVGRELPIRWREFDDGSEYWMTEQVAALFRGAREQAAAR